MGNTESFRPDKSSNPNISGNASGGLQNPSRVHPNPSRVQQEELSPNQIKINQSIEKIASLNENIEKLNFEIIIRKRQKYNYFVLIQ